MNQAHTPFRKVLKVLGLTTTSSVILLLGISPTFAGPGTIATTNDHTATGTMNFNANPVTKTGINLQTLYTNGGVVNVKFAGVTGTASSPTTAVNNGTISQAQVDIGLGSGGVVINLSSDSEAVKAIITASKVSSGRGTVAGAGLEGSTSPAVAISTLSASTLLSNVTVTMPTGAEVTIAQILGNLSTALTSESPILIPTALNDAVIAIRSALRTVGGETNAELQTAGRAVVTLLDALKDSGGVAATVDEMEEEEEEEEN